MRTRGGADRFRPSPDCPREKEVKAMTKVTITMDLELSKENQEHLKGQPEAIVQTARLQGREIKIAFGKEK
jgi:hypothetical protein